MKIIDKVRWLAVLFAAIPVVAMAQDGAKCVTVRTSSPLNREVAVWYHVPAGYDAKRMKPYPVLVYFGGRNCAGKEEASGKLGWAQWADEHGAFLVAPGFKDDDYWHPEAWAGKALFDALAELRRSYRIDDSRVCYYGYSAGSQAANLFAAWRPGRCRAWVSHACGVFHEPKTTMRQVPGLVTCGDADLGRYILSREFVVKARKRGVDVIWKTFPSHGHDVPSDSLRLAREFLAYAIGAGVNGTGSIAFIGDDADAVYYPAGSPEVEFIDPADRVRLPNEAIAAAWGTPGRQ